MTMRVFLLLALVLMPRLGYGEQGILLLAHGGKPEWNAQVAALAAKVDRQKPTEVAFGMATRANIQAAVDRLAKRGVTDIVAVPLFVSSHSSVITSTEYLLGLRKVAPPALAIFAKMSHGEGDHAGHGTPADGTTPVKSPVPIRMAPALNDHPVVAEIVLTRAQEISRDPSKEFLVLVVHGPNDDENNKRWLADLAATARRLNATRRFAGVATASVRDDAPKPVRDAAAAQLRAIVERQVAAGRRILVVPVLIAYGGIEEGIRERLEGLPYEMAKRGLMPDDRLVGWVLSRAE